MRAALIGEKLGHSYSPQIHALLADYSYQLHEVAKEDLGVLMRDLPFDAVNVTIPYKKAVIPYLSEISERARAIGSVNTIVRRPGGSLYGDNTDYYGFAYQIKKLGVSVSGKKALVLGSGGSSATVQAVLRDKGVGEIIVISREGEHNYETVGRQADADIIVNTTPVGMYPKNGESRVDLALFPHLQGVFDLIYNPMRTALMLDAEQRGIPCIGGLSMLVAQAKAASEVFTGKTIDDARIDEITDTLTRKVRNIILIGMPGCGKTTVGKALASYTGREFVDCDAEIVRRAGKSIPDIFAESGEEAFRAIESEVTADLAKESGRIIATGGGVVTRACNYGPLHQNGVIVHLTRDPDALATENRPLSAGKDMRQMEHERAPLYAAFADCTVRVHGPEKTARDILEAIQ